MKKKESIIFPTEGPCQDEFDVLWFLVQLECSGIIFGFRFSTTWVLSFQSKVNGIGSKWTVGGDQLDSSK